MTVASRRGAQHVETPAGKARLLPGPPLIAPARAFTFPHSIAGEEDALARGALWLEAQPRPAAQGTFLAQCALGFATPGVAHGLWPLGDTVLAVAGGYAYRIDLQHPQTTELLAMRPIVDVLPLPDHATLILAGYHAVTVLQPQNSWQSDRLSWEGVTLTACDGAVLHGIGWDMATDEEVPFALDLRTRALSGGGYRIAPSTSSSGA